MTAQHNGGPAFPTHGGGGQGDDPRNHTLAGGMSMRDWFAGQALAGALASDFPLYSYQSIAKEAYALADAMLAARGGNHE